MEVRPDKVNILARTAERSDEIDLKRAEAARARAEQLLAVREAVPSFSKMPSSTAESRILAC